MKSHLIYIVAVTAILITLSFYFHQQLQPLQTQNSKFLSSSISNISDGQIIQLVFEGLFAENNLDGPYMVKYCFDDATSTQIVNFTTNVLAKAAKGSVADLISLVKQIKTFSTTIPETTIDCLGRDQQIYFLGDKYNIDGSIDFQQLQIHVATYIGLHYLQVHRWCVDLNDQWISQQYYKFGFTAGGYGHKLLTAE